ncbi:MAG: endo-1,4-beta-xylanase [Bacteroidota bacterium]|nr:endo-1,4-beta-xylanase [Bacteroidota bacterium]
MLIHVFIPGIAQNNTPVVPSEKGLKDYYKDYFPIGVAVSPQNLQGPTASFIVKHFNSLTPENAMKMGPIHPQENRYYWNDADAIVDFAVAHHMKVRGHNLCWYQQTPRWFFKDSLGNPVSKEVLLRRLKDHITTVVSRYKGKIYAWDVVNEAINDDNSKYFRNSEWYQICGEDFIAKAFEYAHEADPDAQLFYNDYNTEYTGKMERIYKLLKKLVDDHVPINGVGLQSHWSIFSPSESQIRTELQKFSTLGLKIQITELDMSVYSSNNSKPDRRPDEAYAYTPEMEQKQTQQYKMAFDLFREFKSVITGVTFWNVSDRNTWLDSFPVRGRKNYPLLFDQNLQPKKAYQEVINFHE